MSGHVRERLSAFLDDELPALEREAVQAHLQACPPCTGHLEVLRAVDAGARALAVSVPPGYFEALPGRTRARLEKAPRPRTFRLPVWTWAVAAALVLAVITPLTLQKGRAPLSPEPAQYPAPAGAAPSAAEGLASSTPAEAPGKASFEETRALSDDAEAKRRLQVAVNRADRPEGTTTVPGALAKKEDEYAQPAPRLPDTRGAEQERSAAPAPAPVRPRAAGPGGPSAQQAPLQAQAAPGSAPAPAEAAPESAPESVAESVSVLEEREPSRDAQALRREKASGERAGGAALGRVSSAVGSSDERSFQALSAPVPRTLASLRERREAWRSFVREFSSSPRADEARVLVIETGVEAWRVGADPADLARVREDAAAYLARRDAAQAARVRAVLEGLPAATR